MCCSGSWNEAGPEQRLTDRGTCQRCRCLMQRVSLGIIPSRRDRMRHKPWLVQDVMAAGLLLLVAGVALAADKKGDALATKPDPPGTGAYMAQLRGLFNSWDLDKDGYL